MKIQPSDYKINWNYNENLKNKKDNEELKNIKNPDEKLQQQLERANARNKPEIMKTPEEKLLEKDDPDIKIKKKMGLIECETCKNRKYQDQSADPGVSFKSPGSISPEASGAVVMAHEQEHVSNEKSKAQGEDRQVVSQYVTLQTSTCPECGKTYVSGGETHTVTASKENAKPIGQYVKYANPESTAKGTILDNVA